MRRESVARIVSILLASGLLWMVSPAGAAPAAERSAAADPGKVSAELQADLLAARASSVPLHRILVTLASPFQEAAERSMYRSPESLKTVQGAVAEAQRVVLDNVKGGQIDTMHRYASIFGFSAEADADGVWELSRHRRVLRIEKMPVFQTTDVEADGLTHLDQLNAVGCKGENVTIAIIDDGIDASHAAFGGYSGFPTPKIIGGWDYGDNDSDPRFECSGQSHGTATSGVAAGNGGGISGAAPDARLVFLKIQKKSECGSVYLSGDAAAAIDWVVTNRYRHNIRIISMSFGGGLYTADCDWSSTAYANAVNAAVSAGITLFAASGNNANIGAISRPACLSKVISVGAVYDANIGPVGFSVCTDYTTAADKVTCYSNSASILDILSPSHCASTAQAGGGVASCFGGTSSATPYAAGLAASVMQCGGRPLDYTQVRNLLVSTGVPVTDSRNNLTKPRVDAAAARAANSASCSTLNLYGVFYNGELARINTFTGKSTPVIVNGSAVKIGVSGVTSLAHDPSTGDLYVATGEGSDSLYRVDLSTGAVVKVGLLSSGATNIQTMDFAPLSANGFTAGALYGISIDGIAGCGPNCLFRIDKSNAVATPIASLALNQGRAMSFTPLTGELWVYDAGGKKMYTLSGTGQLTYRFNVPSSAAYWRTGVDTVFSIAHNCEGRLFGVDIAYGWLVEFDINRNQAYVINDRGGIVSSGGSRYIAGLDGGGG